ncbi:hypothetical protein [Nonomuraea sp. NPDC023979]|uniref:hypothetical protein n=1 Tax=Nonomuraea sp. NPDC023979 TaxID=3154796 RepID=UPI0033DFE07D
MTNHRDGGEPPPADGVYAYQRATVFRVRVYLGGLGIQPAEEHQTGTAAELDAMRRVLDHDSERMRDRPGRILVSSFAHIEYEIPDGPNKGKVATYGRYEARERHRVTRYYDESTPSHVRYVCACGAIRTGQEIVEHWRNARICTFCGGEEDVHPAGEATVGDRWVTCPACAGSGDYVENPPPFNRDRFLPNHSLRQPLPLSAAGRY